MYFGYLNAVVAAPDRGLMGSFVVAHATSAILFRPVEGARFNHIQVP